MLFCCCRFVVVLLFRFFVRVLQCVFAVSVLCLSLLVLRLFVVMCGSCVCVHAFCVFVLLFCLRSPVLSLFVSLLMCCVVL